MCTAKMWHLSNAGIVLQLNNLYLGIDLFTEDHIPPYQALTPETKEQLFHSDHSLRFLFVTHLHRDHFCFEDLNKYLSLHPQCCPFIPSLRYCENRNLFHTTYFHISKTAGSSWTVSSFQNAYQLKKDNFSIFLLPTSHMGACADSCCHYSILLLWNHRSIFISGDARPSVQLYQTLHSYTDHLDILIAPFPYLSLRSARKSLSSFFLPRQIYLLHLPDPQMDQDHWISSAKQLCLSSKDRLPFPVFCEKLGSCYTLEI